MQPVVPFTTENDARSATSRVASVGKRRFMSGRIAVSTTVKMFLNSFLRHFFLVGRDLIGVQNLMKKHQAVLAEINNHEHRITAVSKSAQQMLHDGHFASDEIKLRAGNLSDHWTQLKEKALQVQSSPT